MKFNWIHQHQHELQDIALACAVLEVSRSGYYAWLMRREAGPSPAAVRRAQLLEQIHQAHQHSRGLYGSPRVHAQLAADGVSVCCNTVAKLMRQANLRSRVARRFRPTTTDARHGHALARNLLERDFSADLPDRKWLVDITYLPTDEGFVYLASVLDACSRKIIGWSMATHLRAELCLDALSMALATRRPGQGLVHHSDRGVQYACDAYQRLLAERGIIASMSRTGDPYDNAMMESFHSTLKNELVYQQPTGRFASVAEARRLTFAYIETFYNRRRRHSSLNYLSPEAFEATLN